LTESTIGGEGWQTQKNEQAGHHDALRTAEYHQKLGGTDSAKVSAKPRYAFCVLMNRSCNMLRRELLIEVEHDHIVVRVTGTSYAASYYRMASPTGLVARNVPSRDDHRAPMSRLEFIKSSLELATVKAKELKWIV
jgi:hypothetical protein